MFRIKKYIIHMNVTCQSDVFGWTVTFFFWWQGMVDFLRHVLHYRGSLTEHGANNVDVAHESDGSDERSAASAKALVRRPALQPAPTITLVFFGKKSPRKGPIRRSKRPRNSNSSMWITAGYEYCMLLWCHIIGSRRACVVCQYSFFLCAPV
jgi:hypothetical protein